MYDLILKGGTVVDASQNLNGRLDLAVQGGQTALLAPAIRREEARRVLDVPGAIVTPGLIDLPRPPCP
jgi:dihydroorotase